MQDELPLALIEEQAEGEIAAEECGENGEGDGFDEPDGADVFGWGGLAGWRRLALAWSAGRGMEGFCVDFSTLRVAG